jgi:uncharacterized protein YsxB (DUF464 family)
MVSVQLAVDPQKYYTGFVCSGHAAYAKRGADIVCAAISILTQTVIGALDEILHVSINVESDEATGYLKCIWINSPEELEQVQLLVKTLILGLSAIQKEYPNHISLGEMEV